MATKKSTSKKSTRKNSTAKKSNKKIKAVEPKVYTLEEVANETPSDVYADNKTSVNNQITDSVTTKNVETYQETPTSVYEKLPEDSYEPSIKSNIVPQRKDNDAIIIAIGVALFLGLLLLFAI